jgi:hypothetical protein
MMLWSLGGIFGYILEACLSSHAVIAAALRPRSAGAAGRLLQTRTDPIVARLLSSATGTERKRRLSPKALMGGFPCFF